MRSRARQGAAIPREEVPGDGGAEWRLALVVFGFLLVYGLLGLRMGQMALSEPSEPRLAASDADGLPVRGEIVDRNGNLMAANLPAWSLYARPEVLRPGEAETVVAELSGIFPDLDADKTMKRLTSGSAFVWVRRPISPREKELVLDLGRPALGFGRRDMRIYPAGRIAAHIVGGTQARREDVRFAELEGSGGIERYFDERLRDRALLGEPVALSIDLAVQSAMTDVLREGVRRFRAKGGTAVLMSVHTGEILGMVSLPDFDPNTRPRKGEGKEMRFNKAVQGSYELGSTFKTLTAAFAIEEGLVAAETPIETGAPIVVGKYRIDDHYGRKKHRTVTDIVVHSSNIGSGQLALRLGSKRLKAGLAKLGFDARSGLELKEAAGTTFPAKWPTIRLLTISYGHGIAVTPIHLTAAYAALANGGMRVQPSIVKGGRPLGERVFSKGTSAAMLDILRQTVYRGTGRRADVPGYSVGGKTGTADKSSGGGYATKRVLGVFAGVFPTTTPEYALVVMMDEAADHSGPTPLRTASRTAVPVAGEIVRRVAPLLGHRPGPVMEKPQPRHIAIGFGDEN